MLQSRRFPQCFKNPKVEPPYKQPQPFSFPCHQSLSHSFFQHQLPSQHSVQHCLVVSNGTTLTFVLFQKMVEQSINQLLVLLIRNQSQMKNAHDSVLWIALGTVTIAIIFVFLLCCFLRVIYPIRQTSRHLSRAPTSVTNPSADYEIPPVADPLRVLLLRSQLKHGDILPKPETTSCAVCLDPIGKQQSAAAPCNHVLHVQCWKAWLEKDDTHSCPICRGYVFRTDKTPQSSIQSIPLTSDTTSVPLPFQTEHPSTAASQNVHSLQIEAVQNSDHLFTSSSTSDRHRDVRVAIDHQ